MSGVCAKHNQYYETECRWCEPPLANTEALEAAFAQVGMSPFAAGKHCGSPYSDMCARCGMSGLQILQNPNAECLASKAAYWAESIPGGVTGSPF